MADTTQAPINGTYAAPHHAYHDSYTNHAQVVASAAAMNTTAASFQPAQQSSTPTNVPANEPKHSDVSKDEVGWFFVEKYYTTMSRSPEKLPLFYSRRSQFVFGTEAESVPVAVGQKAINEAIRQLDFQDCKVRVLNVDSQASFENILVSVIGEISNKSEPSRKFVQTFVLAEQPNGYYVLNDIFRYLADEEEEEEEEVVPVNEAAPSAAAPEEEVAVAPEQKEQPAVEAAQTVIPNAQVENESAAEQVDEKLIEVGANDEAEQPKEVKEEDAAPMVNGTAAAADSEGALPTAVAQSEEPQTEKPATPQPTPAEPAQKAATAPTAPTAPDPAPAPAAAPEKEAAPAKAMPKTWATIASASKSGAAVAVPAIPMAPPKPAVTASSTSQPAAPATGPAAAAVTPSSPTAAPAAVTAAPIATTTDATTSQDAANDNAGWQSVGADHKKTQSRAGDDQNVLAYIKNVNEKVDASLLRQTLTRYGKLKYFDVSRPKNCAFVEFADPAGYAAAVAANPHQIGSEQILVEERRARGSAYGANGSFGPGGRGGASGGGRGRGDRPGSQGRGGFPRDGGRGGFAPRGRGGNTTPKGRSQAQAA